jgi:hypothetical protein
LDGSETSACACSSLFGVCKLLPDESRRSRGDHYEEYRRGTRNEGKVKLSLYFNYLSTTPRRRKGIAPHFLDLALVGGKLSASRPGRFTLRKEPRYPFDRRLGGAGLDDLESRKFLTLPGLELWPLGRPARSQSLYQLRYPGSSHDKGLKNNKCDCSIHELLQCSAFYWPLFTWSQWNSSRCYRQNSASTLSTRNCLIMGTVPRQSSAM